MGTPAEAEPTPEEIRERIERGIAGSRAQVTGDGHHFQATIVSPAFAGLSRLEAHRLVYDCFDGEVGGRIHALSMTCKAE